jgi:hypothetical protein
MLTLCMAVRKMAARANNVLYWQGGGQPTAALQFYAHHINSLSKAHW